MTASARAREPDSDATAPAKTGDDASVDASAYGSDTEDRPGLDISSDTSSKPDDMPDPGTYYDTSFGTDDGMQYMHPQAPAASWGSKGHPVGDDAPRQGAATTVGRAS